MAIMSSGSQANSSSSGNWNSSHGITRMALAWKGESYNFAVNPEDYTQSEPNKATVTQTKGGAWIDAWGEGIKEITIKGITGVYGTSSDPDTGYQRWKNIRNMIQHVYDDVQDGQKVELMQFYNYTDNEYFYVYPAQGGIELLRSKARPHVYQYTLHLVAVRRLGQAEVERQVLGDPGKSTRRQRAEAQDTLTQMLETLHNNGGTKDLNISHIVQYVQENKFLADTFGGGS